MTGVDLDPAMLARARRRADAATPTGPADPHRGRSRRSPPSRCRSLSPRVPRPELAPRPSDPCGPAGRASNARDTPRAGRCRRRRHLAARTPRISRGTTVGSSSSGRGSIPRRARWSQSPGSAQHDAASATVTITTIFEEGRQGEPTRRWVRRDRMRLVSADDLREFAEDAGLDGRDRCRRLRPRAARGRAATAPSSSPFAPDLGPTSLDMVRRAIGTAPGPPGRSAVRTLVVSSVRCHRATRRGC